MGLSIQASHTISDGLLPEKPCDEKRAHMVDWLDDGLRRGERGRLEQEYPLSMAGSRGHRCVFAGESPVAHAMLHPMEALSDGRPLRLGMIGNVYTDPAWRRRGLAGLCVEACVADARSLRLPLAVLWSDAWDFYRALGFHPAGRETQVHVGASVFERIPAACAAIEVGPVRAGDWERLEELYAARPQRARRRPGDLERLAAAPATAVRVARVDGRIAAYAAAGRGDDFQGAVHEWAGETDAVLACLRDLCATAGASVVLAGPEAEEPVARLRAAGARCASGCFALLRLLDAGAVWEAIAPEDREVSIRQSGPGACVEYGRSRVELGEEATLDLLFGRGPEGPLGEMLPGPLRRRLEAVLPWPLYVWGFDSI